MPRCSGRRSATACASPIPNLIARSRARLHASTARKSSSAAARSIRDGMGQSQRVRATSADTVITNALVVDYWGIVKADVAIKDGSHRARSARPAIPTSSPVSTSSSAPGTEIIAGEGMIVTAGGIDSHIHFICPQQIDEALACRRDDDARRRHRPGHRHLRDDVHAGPVAHPRDARRRPTRSR